MTSSVQSDHEARLLEIFVELEALGSGPVYEQEDELNTALLKMLDNMKWSLINDSDPLYKHYENLGMWSKLRTHWKFQEDLKSDSHETGGVPINKYWKVQLDWLTSQTPEHRQTHIEITPLLQRLEGMHKAALVSWLERQVTLEKELLSVSLKMHIFRDDLVDTLLATTFPRDPENHFNCRGSFVSNFWEGTIAAFARYARSIQEKNYKTITKVERDKAEKAIRELRALLDKLLSGLPNGFEPNFELLAYEIDEFHKRQLTALTPKQAHDKNPRQVLIRELLLGWKDAYFWHDLQLSPIKHIVSLVSVIDSAVSEREIYREYALVQTDSKTSDSG